MEIWDAYYQDGTPAGIDLVRGEKIPDGLFHMVSEVLIRHEDGDYLLMKRDPRKPIFSGYEEASAGGSALKGEDAHTCAMRELREETGICNATLTPIARVVSDNVIYYSFLGETTCDKTTITLQKGETVSYRWVNEQMFMQFVRSDRMIPTQKEHYRPYLQKHGYLPK